MTPDNGPSDNPFWRAWDAPPAEDLDVVMRRTMARLLEQARNPPPPEPCHHMELYPGWARTQPAVLSCPWCGVQVGNGRAAGGSNSTCDPAP